MSENIIYPSRPPKNPSKQVIAERKPREQIGRWLIHDPAIFWDETSGYYYVYCTGTDSYRSKDLVNWEYIGIVVRGVPKEAAEWTKGEHQGCLWAPDIIKVGDEYRLYCSNSTWGVRQSCIFLAVSDKAEGPFEYRGIVLKTSDELPVNAIDANIIEDVKTGEQYMVYGSFWGGAHALLLDKETGLAAEEGIGTCLSCRPKWMSAAAEGPYVIYNEKTDYYYLFISYGSLKSDYNVRVGRSRSVLGPYIDFNGREMTDLTDAENEVGFMAFCGYKWNDGKGYMGPGHNSVLHDKDGSWYLVCHIREKNFYGTGEPSTMQIRKIFWTEDGWPLLSAEPYAGEIEQEIPREALIGRWERINLVASLPQGIQTAVPMKIVDKDYYECCSIQGNWQYEDGKLHISYGPHKEVAYVSAVWDEEKEQPTIAITGMSEKGVPFWAKRVGDLG